MIRLVNPCAGDDPRPVSAEDFYRGVIARRVLSAPHELVMECAKVFKLDTFDLVAEAESQGVKLVARRPTS